MTLDYHAVQQASRRVGVKFRLNTVPRPRRTGNHRRLTWASVRWARAWACGDGWGRSQAEQATVLAARLGVAEPTIIDVLTNVSWHDPAYVPNRPDPAVWGHLPPSVALLRLIGGVS